MKVNLSLACRALASAGVNVHQVAGFMALYQSFAGKPEPVNLRIVKKFESALRNAVASRERQWRARWQALK